MPTAEPALVRSLGSEATRGLVLIVRPALRRQLGEPEVEHLGVAVASDEDVRRLDVAVHDPLGVGRRQSLGDLAADPEHASISIGRPEIACLSVSPSSSSITRNGVPSWRPISWIDADVRMVERRCRPRLAHEALEHVLVLRHLLRQELERHLPPSSVSSAL